MKKTEIAEELNRLKDEVLVLRQEMVTLRHELTSMRIKQGNQQYPGVPQYSPPWTSPSTTPTWKPGEVICASGKYPATTPYDKCGESL